MKHLIGSTLLRSLGTGLCLTFASVTGHSAFLTIDLPGSESQDNWSAMTAANYPGYPAYATTANAWPTPIGSTSGGDLLLNKTSGVGFPSNGGGIYVGGITTGTGNYAVYTPAAGALMSIETIVFQIEIQGVGSNYANAVNGVNLDYNGGNQSLAAGQVSLVSAVDTGEVQGSPSYLFTVAYQWDLTSVELTQFSLGWTAAQNTVTSALQVNQGDTMVNAIPEPSTWGLIGVAAVAIAWTLRRRHRA